MHIDSEKSVESVTTIQTVQNRKPRSKGQILRRVLHFIDAMGFNPLKTMMFVYGFPAFLKDYFRIKKLLNANAGGFENFVFLPCVTDRLSQSGEASGHYFHQDLLIATRIHEAKPTVHLDVGSRIDGFVAHVASYRPIEVLDIRPLRSGTNNIKFLQADLMQPLPEKYLGYCDSLSCLHALEHFGLGRYGDKLNLEGHNIGFRNLASMVKSGGTLYLSVPIGPQRIEFNAHRVFNISTILSIAANDFKLDSFSYVDDQGALHTDQTLDSVNLKSNFNCTYGCGIFQFTKIS